MDLNSINGVLRAVIPALLAYCVGKGWILPDTVGLITTAAVSVVAAVWSIISNKPTTA